MNVTHCVTHRLQDDPHCDSVPRSLFIMINRSGRDSTSRDYELVHYADVNSFSEELKTRMKAELGLTSLGGSR